MVPVIENGCGGTELILFVLCLFPFHLLSEGERSRGTKTEKETVIEKGRQGVGHTIKGRMWSTLVFFGLNWFGSQKDAVPEMASRWWPPENSDCIEVIWKISNFSVEVREEEEVRHAKFTSRVVDFHNISRRRYKIVTTLKMTFSVTSSVDLKEGPPAAVRIMSPVCQEWRFLALFCQNWLRIQVDSRKVEYAAKWSEIWKFCQSKTYRKM